MQVLAYEARGIRRSPHRATPTVAYHARLKVTPTSHGTDRTGDTHNRIHTDRVDTDDKLTLRVKGKLHHNTISTASAEPMPEPVLMLVHDLHIRVVNAATGELLRELAIDLTNDYQPTRRPPGPAPKHIR